MRRGRRRGPGGTTGAGQFSGDNCTDGVKSDTCRTRAAPCGHCVTRVSADTGVACRRRRHAPADSLSANKRLSITPCHSDRVCMSRKIRNFRTDTFVRYVKKTEILTRATHVYGWEPAVYMSCMSQNFLLFHVSNLSVRYFRFFSAHAYWVSGAGFIAAGRTALQAAKITG